MSDPIVESLDTLRQMQMYRRRVQALEDAVGKFAEGDEGGDWLVAWFEGYKALTQVKATE